VADVARTAGVSPMTVSRVVNGDPNVSTDKRDRVGAAIEALGYVPNRAARSLAGGRQCRIALLYSNPSAAYLSEFLVGSLAEAGAADAQLTVEYCEGERIELLAERLNKHRVDAVLLPPPLADDDALLDVLRRMNVPLVQVAVARPVDFADAVTIDDEAAAHAMTEHLLARGHRRIGFVVGHSRHSSSELRREGYLRALAEAGLSADPRLIQQGDFTYRSGMVAAETLLALDPRPTAIFASNDDMAAAAIAVAHKHHLDVPTQLSVCGFDDTPIATTIWPELTTVRQPIRDMARLATRLLIDAARSDGDGADFVAQHHQLNYELVVRQSDAVLQA
jgi:LacI family transcriptional regulator